MLLSSDLKNSTNGSNNFEDGGGINGRKSSVLIQDIISEMMPKVQGTTTTCMNEPRALLVAARVQLTGFVEEPPTFITIQKEGKSYTLGSQSNISTVVGKAKATNNNAYDLSQTLRAINRNAVQSRGINHNGHGFYVYVYRSRLILTNSNLRTGRLERGIKCCSD